MKFENEMEWSFQRLFLMGVDAELPWLTYQQFGNLVGNLTDMIVAEQNWQPLFDEVWNNRQVDDYTGKNVNKRDFMRSWTHSRTATHISIEDVLESGGALLRGLDKRLTDKINIPFHIAEDPLLSVAKGTGIALKNVDRFTFLMR